MEKYIIVITGIRKHRCLKNNKLSIKIIFFSIKKDCSLILFELFDSKIVSLNKYKT